MPLHHYHLALPVWNRPPWRGRFYAPGTRAADFLAEYALVFNAVEGNSTFYALPSAATVRKWRDAVPPGFRFCWKLPRAASHDRLLVDAGDILDAFLATVAPLGDRLGPCLVQLPPSFGPDQLDDLARFLDEGAAAAASRGVAMAWTVEVRHPAFFATTMATGSARVASEVNPASAATALTRLLHAHGASRTVMDTRALRAASPADVARPRPGEAAEDTARRIAESAKALRQKPNLPLPPDLSAETIGPTPMLRYVADPNPAPNEPWLAAWARDVAGWIAAGVHPTVVIHAPDDVDGAPIARLWHAALRRAMAARADEGRPAGYVDEPVDVGELPAWPAERGRQLGLWG
ncbi:MAG: DUF72 domain-containing protein [Anaerolineae bacterium]